MGLLIKQNGDKKIKLDGTDIEVPEIYVRIEFLAKADGVGCEVALYQYASAEMYEAKKLIYTDVPTANLYIILKKGQSQSIEVVLADVAEYYTTELGYIVEVID
jgi:hypothetical protein